jgi:hypothetical protein
MIKFNRTLTAQFILSKGIKYGNVTLLARGQLFNKTWIEGYDTIAVRMPGDVNMNGNVDIQDISFAAYAFGSYQGHPRWNYMVDESEDNIIDLVDIALIAQNFGKTYT